MVHITCTDYICGHSLQQASCLHSETLFRETKGVRHTRQLLSVASENYIQHTSPGLIEVLIEFACSMIRIYRKVQFHLNCFYVFWGQQTGYFRFNGILRLTMVSLFLHVSCVYWYSRTIINNTQPGTGSTSKDKTSGSRVQIQSHDGRVLERHRCQFRRCDTNSHVHFACLQQRGSALSSCQYFCFITIESVCLSALSSRTRWMNRLMVSPTSWYSL